MLKKLYAATLLVGLICLLVGHQFRGPISPVSGFPLVHDGETHVTVDIVVPCGYWANHAKGRDLICLNGARISFPTNAVVVVVREPNLVVAGRNIPADRYPVIVVVGQEYAIRTIYSVKDGIPVGGKETGR